MQALSIFNFRTLCGDEIKNKHHHVQDFLIDDVRDALRAPQL